MNLFFVTFRLKGLTMTGSDVTVGNIEAETP